MTWDRIVAFVSALFFLSMDALQAQDPYAVFDLGTFGGTNSNPTAINGSRPESGISRPEIHAECLSLAARPVHGNGTDGAGLN